jgi:hypothetical protein
LPDEVYLKKKYKQVFNKKLNLKNPQTFNEKIQWLKLYDRNPAYHKMIDKYEAKEFVANIIGNEFIVETYGVWSRFDDINFDTLPNQFVLKCTHDAASTIICNDKKSFDFESAKEKLTKALKINYYRYENKQWAYKNITPRIIAEKLIKNNSDAKPIEDYKFMVFNQRVKCTFVCSGRKSKEGLKVTFFDNDWVKLPFERYYKSKDGIPKPKYFEKMKLLAEKISKEVGNQFIRVDFYEIDDKIYFGEITFYPGGGIEDFTPEKWDYELGSWIDLKK